MAIQVRCDCGEILRIPRPAPGEEWKCPSCGATIQGRDNGEEPADAMEIPIEGSSIGPRQEVQGGQAAGSALSGQGDSGKKEEDLEDDLEEPEEPEEYEGSRNGIPKGMLWGVFLVLLGLLGMIFLLKPGTREEPPGPGGIEAPRVEAPAPVGEDASVRIALESSPGKEAAAPQATPLAAAGSGSSAGGEIQTAVTPQAPPQVPAAAAPPQPDAPPAAPSKALEPAAGAPGSSAVPAAPTAPAVQAASAPAAAAPQPKAQPAKPEKLAYSKPAAAKPAGAYTLNVGSFKARKNAEALREDLEQKGIQATVTEVSLPDKGTWYRVSVGRFSTPDAARRLGRELEKKWQIQSFVAQLD